MDKTEADAEQPDADYEWHVRTYDGFVLGVSIFVGIVGFTLLGMAFFLL